ncbi:cyclodeaminase/cyclohydrolase family protein [Thermosediminibacter oceani]|uniref:Formimidoyltetrahydrofolate cyclodeaminase n=1 Tax=Thermosediminibacter oceani (strain ATCC BAA-1034 / DSM 16646 / JW/IW-1228P) TaxID=555079 RepID=D9RXZ7_THEOJ|nr:cyclodeaminase/cyclohydrolase family protein [Thermosediminibacter oceani]ADL08221.1 Formimidoyltetrahydrofolate cyclodeaminase [Thermosediminibacter oceani DSM 16646]
MLLSEYRIKEFVDELASKSPAPGGGSASALAGAMGISLASMVANLTSGKEKFKDREPLLQEILLEAKKIKESLVTLIDRDTDAFNKVAEVLKMPRETEEQKKARSEAMEQALKEAAVIPLTVMEECLKAIRLHEKALGNTTTSALSDLGVGVLCLKAALYGAWLNVKINLNSIKDAKFVEDVEKKARAILKQGTELADGLYQKIEEALA